MLRQPSIMKGLDQTKSVLRQELRSCFWSMSQSIMRNWDSAFFSATLISQAPIKLASVKRRAVRSGGSAFCLSSSGQGHTNGRSRPLRVLEITVECSMQPMSKLWKKAEQPQLHTYWRLYSEDVDCLFD